MNYLQKLYEDYELSSLGLPIIFDDSLWVSPVSFFVADCNSFICESDNFTYTLLYWIIFYKKP